MVEQKLVPELRFPEFSGEWSLNTLGELGKFIGGGTPSTSIEKYWKGEIPWISSADILEDSINTFSKSRFITEEAISESAAKLIPEHSVLMVSRVGIGKFAVADERLATSQDFTNLVPVKSDPYFLAYLFKHSRKRFYAFSQGTSIKGYTSRDIKSLKLLIPLLPEQQKIASFLSAVDKRIELLEKKKELLEQYKKGVMQQIFSQEIRFKDENGNDFPDWEEKKLGEVCQKAQSGGTPRSTNKAYYNGSIPFLAISDMTSQGKYLKKTSKLISKDGLKNSSSWLVPPFSIIYSMYASVGFVSINKIPIATSQAVMNIIPKKSVWLEYLYYYLFYFRRFINRYIETGTQGNINASIVKNIILKVPTLDEQILIADFLSNLDKKIESINFQIDNNNRFKNGLLQKMFV